MENNVGLDYFHQTVNESIFKLKLLNFGIKIRAIRKFTFSRKVEKQCLETNKKMILTIRCQISIREGIRRQRLLLMD